MDPPPQQRTHQQYWPRGYKSRAGETKNGAPSGVSTLAHPPATKVRRVCAEVTGGSTTAYSNTPIMHSATSTCSGVNRTTAATRTMHTTTESRPVTSRVTYASNKSPNREQSPHLFSLCSSDSYSSSCCACCSVLQRRRVALKRWSRAHRGGGGENNSQCPCLLSDIQTVTYSRQLSSASLNSQDSLDHHRFDKSERHRLIKTRRRRRRKRIVITEGFSCSAIPQARELYCNVCIPDVDSLDSRRKDDVLFKSHGDVERVNDTSDERLVGFMNERISLDVTPLMTESGREDCRLVSHSNVVHSVTELDVVNLHPAAASLRKGYSRSLDPLQGAESDLPDPYSSEDSSMIASFERGQVASKSGDEVASRGYVTSDNGNEVSTNGNAAFEGEHVALISGNTFSDVVAKLGSIFDSVIDAGVSLLRRLSLGLQRRHSRLLSPGRNGCSSPMQKLASRSHSSHMSTNNGEAVTAAWTRPRPRPRPVANAISPMTPFTFHRWIIFLLVCVMVLPSPSTAMLPAAAGQPADVEEETGALPGFKYSYYEELPQKAVYESVIICLLAVSAFIGLIVWVLKSNFEERQQKRMRREASLRERTSSLGFLKT